MPMINVVFLLLIFFMVAGTIEPPLPIETTPPDSTQIQELSALRTLHIAADGTMALGAESVSLDSLSDALRIETEISPNDGPPASLAVRADGNLVLEQLQPVLDLLREAGVTQIELVTTWAPADNR